MAFLLGSDYTEGISGVGPVPAMESLLEFSSMKEEEAENEEKGEDRTLEAPLGRFKEWYTSGVNVPAFHHIFVK